MNLNPFDLPGPGFLAFYLVLCTAAALTVLLRQRAAESGGVDQSKAYARWLAQDPYSVAYLNGGRGEVLRVALVSLLERGLLTAKQNMLQAIDGEAVAKVRRPLDKAILIKFATPGKVQSLADDKVVLAEADLIGEELQSRKLLPNPEVHGQRKKRIFVAIPLLWAVAALKIMIALERGRTNILFLIILAAAIPFVLLALIRQFRTAFGDQVFSQLQEMFADLKRRCPDFRIGKTTSEFTFLSAVYGWTALPSALSAVIGSFPSGTKKTFGSTSCSSSCTSLTSCSSGSSCGGGCGGGCGGCGGG